MDAHRQPETSPQVHTCISWQNSMVSLSCIRSRHLPIIEACVGTGLPLQIKGVVVENQRVLLELSRLWYSRLPNGELIPAASMSRVSLLERQWLLFSEPPTRISSRQSACTQE